MISFDVPVWFDFHKGWKLKKQLIFPLLNKNGGTDVTFLNKHICFFRPDALSQLRIIACLENDENKLINVNRVNENKDWRTDISILNNHICFYWPDALSQLKTVASLENKLINVNRINENKNWRTVVSFWIIIFASSGQMLCLNWK